jgi:hypothetical protein
MVSHRSTCVRRFALTAVSVRPLRRGTMTAQIPPKEKARTPVRTISFARVVRGKYRSPHNQMAKSVIVHTIPKDAGGKRMERP